MYLGERGSAIKNEIESSAWTCLARGIGSASLYHDYSKLQKEYVSNVTVEAQTVHAADSIDILLQILELRRRGYPASLLKGLWNETVKKVKYAPVRSAQQLLKVVAREGRKAALQLK
jgi:5'-deoxynucleotidase YfbR-like HD superfamily hydrolase